MKIYILLKVTFHSVQVTFILQLHNTLFIYFINILNVMIQF